MNVRSSTSVLSSAVALLLLAGCGTTTRLSGVWVNPEFDTRMIDNVLIVGVGAREVNRRMYEAEMVAELARYDVTAISSAAVLPTNQQLTKELVEEYVREKGVDTIFVTRVYDIQTDTEYVPPSTSVSVYPGWGHPYYGGWYGYYSHSYSVSYSPGYTYQRTTVILESNLYDTATEQLIWSAQSETFDPTNVEDAIISVSTELVRNLRDQGLLRK